MKATTPFSSTTLLPLILLLLPALTSSQNTSDPLILPRQAITSQWNGQNVMNALEIDAWTKPDCKGSMTKMLSAIKYGTNYDSPGVASVTLSRDLTPDEQLDFSTTAPGKLKPRSETMNLKRSRESTRLEERESTPPHCGDYVCSAPQSQAKGCFNVPKQPTDCWRLWSNPNYAGQIPDK